MEKKNFIQATCYDNKNAGKHWYTNVNRQYNWNSEDRRALFCIQIYL